MQLIFFWVNIKIRRFISKKTNHHPFRTALLSSGRDIGCSHFYKWTLRPRALKILQCRNSKSSAILHQTPESLSRVKTKILKVKIGSRERSYLYTTKYLKFFISILASIPYKEFNRYTTEKKSWLHDRNERFWLLRRATILTLLRYRNKQHSLIFLSLNLIYFEQKIKI